jgi:hypothetical protein
MATKLGKFRVIVDAEDSGFRRVFDSDQRAECVKYLRTCSDSTARIVRREPGFGLVADNGRDA